MVKQPYENLNNEAQQNHGGQRKVESDIFSLYSDITGQSAHPGENISPEIPDDAHHCNDKPQKNNTFAGLMHKKMLVNQVFNSFLIKKQ